MSPWEIFSRRKVKGFRDLCDRTFPEYKAWGKRNHIWIHESPRFQNAPTPPRWSNSGEVHGILWIHQRSRGRNIVRSQNHKILIIPIMKTHSHWYRHIPHDDQMEAKKKTDREITRVHLVRQAEEKSKRVLQESLGRLSRILYHT